MTYFENKTKKKQTNKKLHNFEEKATKKLKLTREVLQLSAPDFLEIFRAAR